MMMDGMSAHWLGNLVLLIVFGVGTVVCFGVAIRMLMRPGEKDKHHAKYLILHDDR